MRMKWLVALLVILQSADSMAQVSVTKPPPVPAPSDVDPIPPDRDWLLRQQRQVPVSESSIKLKLSHVLRAAGTRQSAVQVGTTNITPVLLSRPVTASITPGEPVIAFGIPEPLARLDLDLEGIQYQLHFAEEDVDARTGFRHVTMRVLNNDSSIARFTISADGRSIYGVLRTSDMTYVFEPTADAGHQIVYRYASGDALNDRRRGLIGKSALAKRHHQLEALSEIRPDHSFSDDKAVYVIGGHLGNVRRVSPTSFTRIAERLSSLTGFTGAEKFELVRYRRSSDGGTLATFKQLVGGVPVDAVNEIVVDRTGKVLRLATSLVPEGAQPIAPLLSAQDAEGRMRTEWGARYSRSAIVPQYQSALKLQYRLDREALTLVPFYSLLFEVEGEIAAFYARVDAVSGSVELAEIAAHNVSYVSCRDLNTAPAPGRPPRPVVNCSETRAEKGYAHPAQAGYCTHPADYPATSHCSTTDKKNVYEVMNDIRNTLPGAIATNAPGTPACCAEITDIQVIQGNRGDSVSRAVGTRIFGPDQDGSSAEVLAHEMGHIYVNIYNDYLEVDTNVFAGAVREGTASTFGGLVGAITGRADRYGSVWVHGDGQFYPSATAGSMSASHPNFQYWQDITLSAGSHNGGQVIMRFFRRVQEVSGISNQRLLGVVLGTMAAIRDLDSPGIDAGDFKRAVLSTIKAEEAVLRNAVDAIYAELYRADAAGPLGPPLPPGDPGPIGSPPITPAVWGSFSYCGTHNGVFVSVYSTQWTPTPNTDRYIGWVKMISEVAFRYSTDVPASQTSLLLVANTTAEGRISSCNSIGCSGMSTSSVQVSHVCGQ